MTSYVLLMVFGMISDIIISAIFPYDTGYVSMSVVPHVAFIIIMLLTRKCELKQSILLAVILGTIQDIYGNSTFLIYLSVNVAMVFVAYFWANNITETTFENFFFVMTILFVREMCVYIIMSFAGITSISIMTFISKRVFLTLCINAVLFFLANYLVKIVYRHLYDKDIALRKNEKIAWINMNLKEEKRK